MSSLRWLAHKLASRLGLCCCAIASCALDMPVNKRPIGCDWPPIRRRRPRQAGQGELGISNGRVEAIDNKIKVTVRMGYDFRNTDNLVALLMLRCGDCQPQLPGRSLKARKKGTKGAKSVPSGSRNALFAFLGSSQTLASSVADAESCRSIICGLY